MNRLVIHLHIDQLLPDGENGLSIINKYLDELAKTEGSLTWTEVNWDLSPVLEGEF